ncbi:MAG: type II toxin-antitoxin system RelE/ParE family toxin [Bacteroidota bacterium]
MALVYKRPKAEEDLDEIWFYLALRNEQAATRLIKQITAKLDMVATFPFMGRARDELGAGLRSVLVGDYVAVYQPLAEGVQGIEVIRVFHSRQDIEAEFDDIVS